jgi:hypothetical protein
LPNIELAAVPEEKITRYLLDPSHPVGGAKANFFLCFGFTRDDWQLFATALLKHAHENDVAEAERVAYGTRYAIDGRIVAPDGTRLNIRRAWFIDAGGTTPRFITAHPLPK